MSKKRDPDLEKLRLAFEKGKLYRIKIDEGNGKKALFRLTGEGERKAGWYKNNAVFIYLGLDRANSEPGRFKLTMIYGENIGYVFMHRSELLVRTLKVEPTP